MHENSVLGTVWKKLSFAPIKLSLKPLKGVEEVCIVVAKPFRTVNG